MKQLDTKIFKLHLASEPKNLDSVYLNSGLNTHYLFNNLYGTLVKIENLKAKPYLANKCEWVTPTNLVCDLKQTLKWSDGSPIECENFLNQFRSLLTAEPPTPNAQYLMDIVGAETAIKNKSTKDLGIYCKTKTQLSFKLKKPSAQFIFNLAQPSLSPKANKRQIEFNQGNVLFSGPYKIKQWEKGNSILIENNTYFPIKIKRPLVKFYFISNDNTALTFYTQEKLSLLRRLPTHLKPQYQSSKDFFKIPTLRFDYIGFGSKLQTEDMTSFRQALSHHLNYQELKQLFQSEGTPGCPALLPQFYNGDLCLKKNTLKHSLEPSIQKKSYKLAYSVLGGNDHKKAMEWLQQQWKTNLGLKITLMPIEKGQLHYTLKNLQPDIFRKGVALRAPSCLSALESFHSESPNNYINLKSKDFDSLLEKMDNPLLNDKQLKDLCTKSINFLLSKNKIIPLGYFSYFMLQDGKFKGWKINALNQLDLTHLQTCDKLFCKDY